MRASRSPRRCRAPTPPPQSRPDFARLLVDAVTKPGVVSSAYRHFWNYSSSNQLLAYFECASRNIGPGPIHTFAGWLAVGRFVRKGERAITLCMPIQVRGRPEAGCPPPPERLLVEPSPDETFTRFVHKPHWFVLSQTDGAEYQPVSIPQWDETQALYALHVDRVPFRHADGNCQGYAQGRQVAVSPVAYLPHRTLLHEVAHVLLGHTEELVGLVDHHDQHTPKDVREVEAEAVAYLSCQSLGMPGEAFSRGYLQHWLGDKHIDERSARRIFAAADKILKAGRPTSDRDHDAGFA